MKKEIAKIRYMNYYPVHRMVEIVYSRRATLTVNMDALEMNDRMMKMIFTIMKEFKRIIVDDKIIYER